MYKLKRNLTLCFVMASLLSCSKEGPSVPSENTGVMPQNIIYDEVLSSSSSISVIWDKDAAFNAGAVAFTVQLVKDPTADEAVFSHRIKTYEPRPCDTYCFCNLKQYERFYVRVRADYATGVSDWTYLGSPTVIETGTGPIDGSVNLYTVPQARLRAATAGSLAFEWSVTGYEYMELDLKRNYKVALFRDAACTDLLVSWILRASDNVFDGLEAGYWFEKDFPAFLFTGLEADRDYWFQVSDVTDGERVSETVKARTQVSKVAVSQALSPAAVGTYALYEDFEELIWGGGGFFRAAAYSSLMRYTANTFVKANGENPVNGPELFFPCGQNNEYELFSSMSAPVSHTRLKDWGQLETTGLIAGRAGCLRIGSSSAMGELVTPALTNLTATATVEVGFDARNYYARESRDIKVEVLTDATMSSEGHLITVADGNRRTVARMKLNGGYRNDHYAVQISGVKPGDRIAVGGDSSRATTAGLRFYLDNFYVKVISY